VHVLLGVTLWRQERPKTSGICSRTPIMNSIVSSQLWTEESCAKYVASKDNFLERFRPYRYQVITAKSGAFASKICAFERLEQ
jgi:hypothetical protein